MSLAQDTLSPSNCAADSMELPDVSGLEDLFDRELKKIINEIAWKLKHNYAFSCNDVEALTANAAGEAPRSVGAECFTSQAEMHSWIDADCCKGLPNDEGCEADESSGKAIANTFSETTGSGVAIENVVSVVEDTQIGAVSIGAATVSDALSQKDKRERPENPVCEHLNRAGTQQLQRHACMQCFYAKVKEQSGNPFLTPWDQASNLNRFTRSYCCAFCFLEKNFIFRKKSGCRRHMDLNKETCCLAHQRKLCSCRACIDSDPRAGTCFCRTCGAAVLCSCSTREFVASEWQASDVLEAKLAKTKELLLRSDLSVAARQAPKRHRDVFPSQCMSGVAKVGADPDFEWQCEQQGKFKRLRQLSSDDSGKASASAGGSALRADLTLPLSSAGDYLDALQPGPMVVVNLKAPENAATSVAPESSQLAPLGDGVYSRAPVVGDAPLVTASAAGSTEVAGPTSEEGERLEIDPRDGRLWELWSECLERTGRDCDGPAVEGVPCDVSGSHVRGEAPSDVVAPEGALEDVVEGVSGDVSAGLDCVSVGVSSSVEGISSIDIQIEPLEGILGTFRRFEDGDAAKRRFAGAVGHMFADLSRQVIYAPELDRVRTAKGVELWTTRTADEAAHALLAGGGPLARRRTEQGEVWLETRTLIAMSAAEPVGLMKLRVLGRVGEPFLVLIDLLYRGTRAPAGPVGSKLLGRVLAQYAGCRVVLCTVEQKPPGRWSQTAAEYATVVGKYWRAGFVPLERGGELLAFLQRARAGWGGGGGAWGDVRDLVGEELEDALPVLDFQLDHPTRPITVWEHRGAGVDGVRLARWAAATAGMEPAWIGVKVEVRCGRRWWKAEVGGTRGSLGQQPTEVLIRYGGDRREEVIRSSHRKHTVHTQPVPRSKFIFFACFEKGQEGRYFEEGQEGGAERRERGGSVGVNPPPPLPPLCGSC